MNRSSDYHSGSGCVLQMGGGCGGFKQILFIEFFQKPKWLFYLDSWFDDETFGGQFARGAWWGLICWSGLAAKWQPSMPRTTTIDFYNCYFVP